jgi:hypothetical protein
MNIYYTIDDNLWDIIIHPTKIDDTYIFTSPFQYIINDCMIE